MCENGLSRFDWRNEANYRLLGCVDRAGLAWEWLRRDPNYRAWARKFNAPTAPHGGPLIVEATQPRFQARWGLDFR